VCVVVQTKSMEKFIDFTVLHSFISTDDLSPPNRLDDSLDLTLRVYLSDVIPMLAPISEIQKSSWSRFFGVGYVIFRFNFLDDDVGFLIVSG